MLYSRTIPLLTLALLTGLTGLSGLVGCSHVGRPQVIYLARHGQTEWNRKSRLQGDPDLDQVGYINRLSLWKLLRKQPLGAIYTSERQRTRRTAELLARQHKLTIKTRAALNEINPGIFEGICYHQLKGAADSAELQECVVAARSSRPEATLRYARAAFKRVWGDRVDGKPPLGQSFRELVEQVKPFVKELDRSLKTSEVLVVGHGVVNRALLHYLLGWSLQAVNKLRQGNDQVYKIELAGTPTVSLYTPGVGWKRCSPPKPGDRHLDCAPGSQCGAGGSARARARARACARPGLGACRGSRPRSRAGPRASARHLSRSLITRKVAWAA